MIPVKEQLQVFANSVNERWQEAGAATPSKLDIYIGKSQSWFNPTKDDHYNSNFIIWGLDRLEEIGWDWQIDNLGFGNEEEGEYRICLMKDDGDERIHNWDDGPTRALAVFWALFRALGCAEPEDVAETSTKQKEGER